MAILRKSVRLLQGSDLLVQLLLHLFKPEHFGYSSIKVHLLLLFRRLVPLLWLITVKQLCRLVQNTFRHSIHLVFVKLVGIMFVKATSVGLSLVHI